MTDFQKFHEHLDNCHQCKNNPFNLCKRGQELLQKAATENELITLSQNEEDVKRGLYNVE